MDSAAIVDLRANVKPVLSTLTGMKATAGFSYILNGPRFTRGRLASEQRDAETCRDARRRANERLL